MKLRVPLRLLTTLNEGKNEPFYQVCKETGPCLCQVLLSDRMPFVQTIMRAISGQEKRSPAMARKNILCELGKDVKRRRL